MNLTLVETEKQTLDNIKVCITLLSGITPDEKEDENSFTVWLGHDGDMSKAIGIRMDKHQYPIGYEYKAYTALLHNLTILMADQTNFLIYLAGLKEYSNENERNG